MSTALSSTGGAMEPVGAMAMILRYHRVTDILSDPHGICVSPRRFAAHMEILHNCYVPLMLKDLVSCLDGKSIPDRAVVVTFDDGYADNLEVAKPLLERYQIPATVFVTTGYLDQKKEFWWDRLEKILLQPGQLPARLYINLPGRSPTWDLRDGRHYTDQDFRQNRWWNWRSKHTPTIRHRLFREIFRVLQPMRAPERDVILARLAETVGIDLILRPTHRVLSAEDVRELARGGLVELGSHTVTHPLLSFLSDGQQEDEILNSKATLEQLIDQPVTNFAYPYGVHRKSTVSVQIVQRAGFTCACSTEERVVRPSTDPFSLPRFYVGDWDGYLFQQFLAGFTAGRA